MNGRVRTLACMAIALGLFGCGSKEVVVERTPEENARMDAIAQTDAVDACLARGPGPEPARPTTDRRARRAGACAYAGAIENSQDKPHSRGLTPTR